MKNVSVDTAATRLFFYTAALCNLLFWVLLAGYHSYPVLLGYHIVFFATGIVSAYTLALIGQRTGNRVLRHAPPALICFIFALTFVPSFAPFANVSYILFYGTLLCALLYAVGIVRAGEVFGAVSYLTGIAVAFIVLILTFSLHLPPPFFWILLFFQMFHALGTAYILVKAGRIIEL